MTDPVTRLNAALDGCYRIERQLGEGGMATVYLAGPRRHLGARAVRLLSRYRCARFGLGLRTSFP